MAAILDADRLTLHEACEECEISRATIHRWQRIGIRGRKLRFVRIGWRSYVLRDELERFIASMSDPAPEPEQSDDFARRAAAANERAAALGL